MADLEAQRETESYDKDATTIFERTNRLVTLTFVDVMYKVKAPKSEEKLILKGVSGKVQPGEVLAMLGPSGSGKTTLLTGLGGRLNGHLTGTINYNGAPFSNKMKRYTGFVNQDDVLYPHLTVTETLVFTALLRLPNSFTEKEKIAQAEGVVSQLGLAKCKDSIIGGSMLRGVSGGERKRVSIGQEMLINPSLLFLDEPTSGLDSTTAQKIVSLLWGLASGGRTVVMSIHQPSSRIFYMFHKVLLLSEGNVLYFGKGDEVMDYFSDIGYSPSVAMNPSDFLLDLANGITSDDSTEDQAVVKQLLVSAFKTNLSENLKMEVRKTGVCHWKGPEEKQFDRWATTWCQQCNILFRRGVKEWKHETFSGLRIAQVLFVAFLSGLLWWQSDTAHLQDQIGLLFFIPSFWGFFALFEAMFTFPQERQMLEKERSSGMYRLSSYFMARTIGDLPMQLVLPTTFITITYWMAGLKPSALSFLETLFALLFCVFVSQSLGLAIGAVVMDQKSATTLGSVIMLSYQLAGGYLVQHVPPFIAWIKYLSMSQYTFKLFILAQYKSTETYPCVGQNICLVRDFPSIKLVGLHGRAVSIVAMAIMLVGFRLIAYMALIRIGVTRKIK